MKRFLMTLTAGIVLAVSTTTHAQALKVSELPSAAVMSGDDLLMIVTRLPSLANKQIELDALSESITKLGTIASGTWEATPITDDYIASASVWNNSLQAGDIGSTVQGYSGTLASLAGLTLSADRGLYATGAGTLSSYPLTNAGRTLLADADAAAQRATLGLGNVENTALSNWSGSGNLKTTKSGLFSSNGDWSNFRHNGQSGFGLFRPSGGTGGGLYFGESGDTGDYAFRGMGNLSLDGDYLLLSGTGNNPTAGISVVNGYVHFYKEFSSMVLGTTAQSFPIQILGSRLTIEPGGVERVRVTSAGVGIGTTDPGRPLHVAVTDHSVNTVVHPFKLTHASHSTPTSGFGVGMELEIGNGSGNQKVAATIHSEYTSVTDTSENADVVVKTLHAGVLSEVVRISGGGKVILHNLPTTSDGLASGQLWNDGGTLKVAP